VKVNSTDCLHEPYFSHQAPLTCTFYMECLEYCPSGVHALYLLYLEPGTRKSLASFPGTHDLRMRLEIHVIAQFLKGQKVNLPFKARYIGGDALQL